MNENGQSVEGVGAVDARGFVTGVTNRTEETWMRLTKTAFDSAVQRSTVTQRVGGASPETAVSMYGRVIERRNLDARETVRFDALGRGISVMRGHPLTGAWMSTVSNEYDAAGDIVATVCDYAGGGRTEEAFLRDSRGAETNRVDTFGNAVETLRDGEGRSVSVAGPGADCPSRRGYDSFGRSVLSATTRDGSAWDETRFLRDAASGLVTNTLYAGGDRMSQSYTPDGKPLAASWWRGGCGRENVYDEAGRLSARRYANDLDTPPFSFSYTDGDLLERAFDAEGAEYAYAYDGALRCTNESATVAGRAFSVARTLDARGRPTRTSVSDPVHGVSSRACAYDGEGRLSSVAVTNAQGRAARAYYSYDGNLVSNLTVELPGGGVLSLSVERDAGGRGLELRREYRFNGLPLRVVEYARDAGGRVTNALEGAVSSVYGYDARSRVVSAASGTNAWGYAYDTAGNRTAASFNGAADAYAANAANQYTLAGGVVPAYGPGGWLTASGGLGYWFDDEDRLAAAFEEGTLRETVSRYDHLHRRMARHTVTWSPDYSACVTNAGRVFAYDGWNLVREWRTDAAGATNVLDYCWGLDLSGTLGGAGGIGGLLAVSVGGDFYLPLYDANGNVTAYIDESGNAVAQYTYDAFGNTIARSGPLADAFPFRFSTKYFDEVTGFYYYGLRYYSPEWGRWVSRDPIGGDGGLNLYAFCGSDPVNGVDPLGLLVVRPVAGSPRTSSTLDGWFNGLWASVAIFPDEGKRLTGTVFHMKHTYINITDCNGNPIIDNKSENVQKRFPTDGTAGWNLREGGRMPVYVNIAHLKGFGKCVKGKIQINSYWKHFPPGTRLPRQGSPIKDFLSGSKDAESFPHGNITATRYPKSAYDESTSSLLITVELSCSQPHYTITASANGIDVLFSVYRKDRDEDMHGSNPYEEW